MNPLTRSLVLLTIASCGGANFTGGIEIGSKGSDSGIGGQNQDSGIGYPPDSSSFDAQEPIDSGDGSIDAASLPSPSICLSGFSALACAAICVQTHASTGCSSVLECFRKNDCTPSECATKFPQVCYTEGVGASYASQAYKECCNNGNAN